MMHCSIIAHVLVASAFLGALAIAQPEREKAQQAARGEHPQGQPDMDAGAAAWMAAMTPGKPHEWLTQFEGEWDTTMNIYMPGADEPISSKGESTQKMVLGGRFLEQKYTGEMMGQPYEGQGLLGYDNFRKQFTGTWADGMTTSILRQTGSLSPDAKTLTMFGPMDEPMTGEVGKTVKYSTRIESPDRHIFTVEEVMYGEPFKVVEITYDRKK